MVLQYFTRDAVNEGYKKKKGKKLFAAIKTVSIKYITFGTKQLKKTNAATPPFFRTSKLPLFLV